MITDFGRTRNLIASARLQEKAKQSDADATREDIILATDQVFYQAIEAQATLRVAQQTVDARQTVADQITALTNAKLKSDIDLSFVQVNLSQAKLLQLDAQNNVDAARAALSAVLGFDHLVGYDLVDDTGDLPKLPSSVDQFIKDALQNRPDLQSLQFSAEAEQKFSTAQRDQQLPSISALGVVGYTPWGSSQYFITDWYGRRWALTSVSRSLMASVIVLRPKRHGCRLQPLWSRRTILLTGSLATYGPPGSPRILPFSALPLPPSLSRQTNLSLDLAQTRYKLGLSSIVELSQAQLQQTQAAIDNVNARSQFELAYADLQFQTGATH